MRKRLVVVCVAASALLLAGGVVATTAGAEEAPDVPGLTGFAMPDWPLLAPFGDGPDRAGDTGDDGADGPGSDDTGDDDATDSGTRDGAGPGGAGFAAAQPVGARPGGARPGGAGADDGRPGSIRPDGPAQAAGAQATGDQADRAQDDGRQDDGRQDDRGQGDRGQDDRGQSDDGQPGEGPGNGGQFAGRPVRRPAASDLGFAQRPRADLIAASREDVSAADVSSSPAAPVQQQVLALVNQHRRRGGCDLLSLDRRLIDAANEHAADMARRRYFAHESPNGERAGDRVTDAGYRWKRYGENIARGADSPYEVVDGWMHSPAHRENILDCRLHEMGIGLAIARDDTPYWVQDFATPAG